MTQITAEVRHIPELFSLGRFEVPWHQRHYDWGGEQVGELLVDLKDALEDDRKSYFLGSIMLVGDGNPWEVNDGQQRLITLSLLFAAFSRYFARRREVEVSRERLALQVLFDHRDIGEDRLQDVIRLRPPLHDRSSFIQLVRGHDVGTVGKLTSAWNLILPFVGAMDVATQCAFFDFLTERVEISVLYVPSTEDTNAVFEALNGRGKTLEDIDLIRNHLYSYFADPSDGKRRAVVHRKLEGTLSSLSMARHSRRAREYFRCFFQCEYGFLQDRRFYRATRAHIRAASGNADGRYVYDIVDELAMPASVELFRSISAPTPNRDLVEAFCRSSGTSDSHRNLAAFLNELRNYKVVNPILFALLRLFINGTIPGGQQKLASAIHRSVSNLTSFVMRVALCQGKFEPSKFEMAFANCAQEITQVRTADDIDLMGCLRECDGPLIIDDERFISRLAATPMKNTQKRAKLLLSAISRARQPDDSGIDISGCTVKPVLPRSEEHWERWTGFRKAGPDLRDWVDRVGNLALLEAESDYRAVAIDLGFSAKRPVFEESRFWVTRTIAECDNWTPDEIDRRSWELAGEAARVWAFS